MQTAPRRTRRLRTAVLGRIRPGARRLLALSRLSGLVAFTGLLIAMIVATAFGALIILINGRLP
jgi:hypothetical protein